MRYCLLLFALVLLADSARAEVTNITVRVIARNAQYVGDLVDGAFVAITDAASGEMMAQGITSGAAGNPERTMRTARKWVNRWPPKAMRNLLRLWILTSRAICR